MHFEGSTLGDWIWSKRSSHDALRASVVRSAVRSCIPRSSTSLCIARDGALSFSISEAFLLYAVRAGCTMRRSWAPIKGRLESSSRRSDFRLRSHDFVLLRSSQPCISSRRSDGESPAQSGVKDRSTVKDVIHGGSFWSSFGDSTPLFFAKAPTSTLRRRTRWSGGLKVHRSRGWNPDCPPAAFQILRSGTRRKIGCHFSKSSAQCSPCFRGRAAECEHRFFRTPLHKTRICSVLVCAMNV